MSYYSKGRTTKIGAVSRTSIKIFDGYYTFEASMEREFPEEVNLSPEELKEEWDLLYQELNDRVDDQVFDVESAYAKAEEDASKSEIN